MLSETSEVLQYTIKDPLELNLAYMPFIEDGGLFIPSDRSFVLDENISVDLLLPGKTQSIRIIGKIIWITPKNALHHVLPGIGIRFTGADSKTIRETIEASLDRSTDIGGYTYGITEEHKSENQPKK